MILKEVFKKETVNNCRLSGILERSDGKTIELFLEYPLANKDFLNEIAGPFFPILLLPAMREGGKLVILQALSKNLFSQSSPG
ncbi:MAG: hypothetical protein EA412_04715 [Chitinophagaceae bacterium]|nr:MAG: hypothetical protein EA412_04715 [Chitinophagaceae bacterium]